MAVWVPQLNATFHLGVDGAEHGLLPTTQVPAAPVARAAGKPICEQDGDGQLAALGVSNGEGMCVARRAVGVAWLTWLLRVGEPGRVVAIGIWSHTVWDLHCVE